MSDKFSNASKSAPYRMQIYHEGQGGNVLYIFKWYAESKRMYMFQKAKGQLEFYRIAPIKLVVFYDNQNRALPAVGRRTKEGLYTGEMEFMNYITPLR